MSKGRDQSILQGIGRKEETQHIIPEQDCTNRDIKFRRKRENTLHKVHYTILS